MKDWIYGIAVGMLTGVALATNPRVRKMAYDAKKKASKMKCCFDEECTCNENQHNE